MSAKYRFYVGEDIEIELECYDLDSVTTPVDISVYDFLLLLYTDKWEPITMSTIDSPDSVKVDKVGVNGLYVHVSSDLTKNLRPGMSRLEVMAKYQTDDWKSIATLSLIEFLPNQIGRK